MYCFKCGEHIKDGSLTCSNCGATQPKVDNAPNISQPPPQRPVQQSSSNENQLPQSYYTDSWLLLAVVLIIGLVRFALALSSGGNVYKPFIICLASLIFLPQIKVNSNSVAAIFAIKIIAAAVVILFL